MRVLRIRFLVGVLACAAAVGGATLGFVHHGARNVQGRAEQPATQSPPKRA